MKFIKTILILLSMIFSAPLFAQLAMHLTSNQATYMQYEPIYMLLRIRNDSGRPIVFSKNAKLQAKLYFEVTDLRGKPVFSDAPAPLKLVRGKVINPGQIGDIVLKFSHFYNLQHTGSYRIHAYISHPLFKEQFKSNDIRIDIARGVAVWKRTIGVPDGRINQHGEVISHDSSRTYSIKKITDGNGQFFYCTLEDKDKMYQVFRMGPVVSPDKPGCIVDIAGSLHILVEIDTKIFKYYKVDISGQLLESNKYYKAVKTTPILSKGSDGKIFVSGGEIAVPNVDFLVREKSFTTMSE